MASASASELIAAGDPRAALAVLQADVRRRADDAKLRVFLFQLLAVLGDWPRALAQLQVCAQLDAGTLAMVTTYREAVQCEAVREAVFRGEVLPHVLGRSQAWVAWLAEALQADARGHASGAQSLRDKALEAAPTTAGMFDGEPFEWIADADSRLGPTLEAVINGRYCWVPFAALAKIVIEAPVDLRDLVWAPAQLEFHNGGASVALLPVRYAGMAAGGEAALQMARRTDWVEIAEGQFRGLGQRVLTTSASEKGILDSREIVLSLDPADAGIQPG